MAHILPLTLSKNGSFCFFEKIPVTAASLKKTDVSCGFSAYLLDCLLYFVLLIGIRIRRGVRTFFFDARDSSFRFSYLLWHQNPFQIEILVRKLAKRQGFSKILSHWNFIFENFQKDGRKFFNSSFDREFHTEKRYNRPFFDKMGMSWDMTPYIILFMNDFTKSLKMR